MARRQTSWPLVTIICALAMLAPAARAEEAPLDPSAYTAWTSTLPAKLHLTDAQKAALDRWSAVLRQWLESPPNPSMHLDPSAPGSAGIPLPKRFDQMVDYFETIVGSMRVQAKALHDFYDLLSPEQREQFDEAALPSFSEHPPPSRDEVSDAPPPAPDYQLPNHTNPEWLVKPTSADVSRVYPMAALKAKISGQVKLKCVADEAGYLTECSVTDEAPDGYGFGNAALEITAYMRMKPATNFGVPVRATVHVPVDFTVAY